MARAKRERMNIRLPKHIVNWLREQPATTTELIETALEHQYDIPRPKPPLINTVKQVSN